MTAPPSRPAPDRAQPRPARVPAKDRRFQPTGPVPDSEEAVLDAYRRAREFYRARLDHSAWVKAYLASRLPGVDPALVEAGHAPAGWTALVDHLRGQGIADQTLLAAGLARQGRRGLYDVFRDRLVFPVRDADGNLVAFTGRAHPGEAEEDTPKWINSAAHLKWRKRELLAGMAEAAAMPSTTAIAIVEGIFDQHAITIATRGEVQAVAPLGTAFTTEHAQALHRLMNLTRRRVIIATDADHAGNKAAEQIYGHLISLGVRPERLLLADGTDPGQAFQTLGREGLARAVAERTRPMVDVLIDQAVAVLGDSPQTASPEHRVHALRRAARRIAELGETDPRRADLTVYTADKLTMDVLIVHKSVQEALVVLDPAVTDPEAAIEQLHREWDEDDARLEALEEQHQPSNGGQTTASGQTLASPGEVLTEPQGEAMTASARITIEHTSTGTRVFGTDQSDEQAHDGLRGVGFKWSSRKGFWYLNSRWLEPTRRERVSRLRRLLTDLGRDHDLQASDLWRTVPAGSPVPTAFSQLSDIEQAIVRGIVQISAGSIGTTIRDQTGPEKVDTVARTLAMSHLRDLADARGGLLVEQAAGEILTADPSVMDRKLSDDEQQQILGDRRTRARRLLGDIIRGIGDRPWDEEAITSLEQAFHQAQIEDPGRIENDGVKWNKILGFLRMAHQRLDEGQPFRKVTAPAPDVPPSQESPSRSAPNPVQETLPLDSSNDDEQQPSLDEDAPPVSVRETDRTKNERAPDTMPIVVPPIPDENTPPPENPAVIDGPDQAGQAALEDVVKQLGEFTMGVAGLREDIRQLRAVIDTALQGEGNPSPVKGSGRVEKAVRVLDDAYTALRPHLRALATSPHVQWLKEIRDDLTGLWDKAVTLSERTFSKIRPRLRRTTHTAAALMYVLAEKIAPRLPNNATTRKAVELFQLGAALVAQSTRDTDADPKDTGETVGRIRRALATVRRNVPDVQSLPGGKDLLAMIEAVDRAQATAQALPARVSRELNLPGRIRGVVSATAERITVGADRLARWMRSNGRDEQQVKAVQALAEESRHVAEQTQHSSPDVEETIAETLGTPETPVPGSVRSTTVADALSEQVDQRFAAITAKVDKPMPSVSDRRTEEMITRMRERVTASRQADQNPVPIPPGTQPQETQDGTDPVSVVHTRNLGNLDADLRRLGIAVNALNEAIPRYGRTGVADAGLTRAFDQVYKQMGALQQRRRGAGPSEQAAGTWWTTDERPRRRAAQA